MKVGIVCPYAWDRFGGVQSHIRALARALRTRGHTVEIIAPIVERPPGDEGVTIVGRAVSVPANGSVAPIAFGPVAAAGMRRVLKAAAPDVLHLHEPLLPSLSLLALWNSEIPAVGTFHASADSNFGYRAGRVVLDRAVRRLAVRTAVSEAARELVERYFPGDYELTPNGIDVDRFASAEPLEMAGEKSVLFLGRLEKRKGLEVLIRALGDSPRPGTVLTVVGAGPEEERCRRLAGDLDVDARFIGRLSDEDVPRAYRGADLYCAPNLGGESFGIVLTEAMSAGTPVVCSDIPGFRAVASDAAALVAPGDHRMLAGMIHEVLDDDDRAARMSVAGRDVAARFDWARLVEGVEALYGAAVGATPPLM